MWRGYKTALNLANTILSDEDLSFPVECASRFLEGFFTHPEFGVDGFRWAAVAELPEPTTSNELHLDTRLGHPHGRVLVPGVRCQFFRLA